MKVKENEKLQLKPELKKFLEKKENEIKSLVEKEIKDANLKKSVDEIMNKYRKILDNKELFYSIKQDDIIKFISFAKIEHLIMSDSGVFDVKNAESDNKEDWYPNLKLMSVIQKIEYLSNFIDIYQKAMEDYKDFIKGLKKTNENISEIPLLTENGKINPKIVAARIAHDMKSEVLYMDLNGYPVDYVYSEKDKENPDYQTGLVKRVKINGENKDIFFFSGVIKHIVPGRTKDQGAGLFPTKMFLKYMKMDNNNKLSQMVSSGMYWARHFNNERIKMMFGENYSVEYLQSNASNVLPELFETDFFEIEGGVKKISKKGKEIIDNILSRAFSSPHSEDITFNNEEYVKFLSEYKEKKEYEKKAEFFLENQNKLEEWGVIIKPLKQYVIKNIVSDGFDPPRTTDKVIKREENPWWMLYKYLIRNWDSITPYIPIESLIIFTININNAVFTIKSGKKKGDIKLDDSELFTIWFSNGLTAVFQSIRMVEFVKPLLFISAIVDGLGGKEEEGALYTIFDIYNEKIFRSKIFVKRDEEKDISIKLENEKDILRNMDLLEEGYTKKYGGLYNRIANKLSIYEFEENINHEKFKKLLETKILPEMIEELKVGKTEEEKKEFYEAVKKEIDEVDNTYLLMKVNFRNIIDISPDYFRDGRIEEDLIQALLNEYVILMGKCPSVKHYFVVTVSYTQIENAKKGDYIQQAIREITFIPSGINSQKYTSYILRQGDQTQAVTTLEGEIKKNKLIKDFYSKIEIKNDIFTRIRMYKFNISIKNEYTKEIEGIHDITVSPSILTKRKEDYWFLTTIVENSREFIKYIKGQGTEFYDKLKTKLNKREVYDETLKEVKNWYNKEYTKTEPKDILDLGVELFLRFEEKLNLEKDRADLLKLMFIFYSVYYEIFDKRGEDIDEIMDKYGEENTGNVEAIYNNYVYNYPMFNIFSIDNSDMKLFMRSFIKNSYIYYNYMSKFYDTDNEIMDSAKERGYGSDDESVINFIEDVIDYYLNDEKGKKELKLKSVYEYKYEKLDFGQFMVSTNDTMFSKLIELIYGTTILAERKMNLIYGNPVSLSKEFDSSYILIHS
ncbi:MAG: hypothetical protein NC918_06115 [Candidatus Omnitrophica bacterium]|nr:hypothetical protein [Candidatus Omnitrophota bacterium]